MRGSGVSVGSGEDTPEGFDAEASERERAEGLRAAEAAGASSSVAPPREIPREEPALRQPRPPPLAGFGANRPVTELSPDVKELMDDVLEKAKDDLRQRLEESRRLRPEGRHEGAEERARARELNHYFHLMLELQPDAAELPDVSGGSEDSSGRGPGEGRKKWSRGQRRSL